MNVITVNLLYLLTEERRYKRYDSAEIKFSLPKLYLKKQM